MANNREPQHPKSVYIHKRNHGKLVAGPVWDFDWGTFDINRNGLTNWNAEIFKNLIKKKHFRKILFDRWENDKLFFYEIFDYIDSLANYISASNQRNINLWPINENNDLIGDENKTFYESIEMLKKDICKRINELDSLIVLQK